MTEEDGGFVKLLRSSHQLFQKVMEPLDELSRWFFHRGSYEVGMMLADHIRYLREKAAHLRRAARNYPGDLAQRLIDLATEFEAKATEMEASQPGNRGPN